MVKIAPSLLSADFARLGEAVRQVEAAGADFLHLDVMDGHFVPNITIGPLVVEALRPHSRLPFDVHLMIEQPERYVEAFARAGADYISVHAEACTHLHRVLQSIRLAGARPAVALNPATPLSAVQWVLPEVELVLLMTVNPGFGGQQFLPFALEKVRQLRRLLDEAKAGALLEVDGGINGETAAAAVAAGADVLVAGAAVFGSPDPAAAVRSLRAAAEGERTNE